MELNTWITQLRKGLAEFILLKALEQGEAYGYEIMQRLAHIDHLTLGESTVYPLLSRRTADGCLSIRIVPSESGPPRRYYRLTPKGKIRVQAMNAYWEGIVESIQKMKAK
jgi:PadR family transcriptional regulator, regulatory protein PadR